MKEALKARPWCSWLLPLLSSPLATIHQERHFNDLFASLPFFLRLQRAQEAALSFLCCLNEGKLSPSAMCEFQCANSHAVSYSTSGSVLYSVHCWIWGRGEKDCIDFYFYIERNKEICLHQVEIGRKHCIVCNFKIHNEMYSPVCISESKLLSKCRTLWWCWHSGRSQLWLSCSVLQ